jgi:uncharacterized protein (TIGR03067 family)
MRTLSGILVVVLIVSVVGCRKKPDSSGGGPTAEPQLLGESASKDSALAQGAWQVTKVELGEPEGPSETDLREITVVFKDNLITVSLGKGARQRHAVFTLDTTHSPKWFDVTESNERGGTAPVRSLATQRGGKDFESQRPKSKGLYKFDGDQLILAMGEPDGPRPTDFKPMPKKRGNPGQDTRQIVVVYLKKK